MNLNIMLYYLSGLMFLLFSMLSLLIGIIMMLNKINLFLEWNIFIINSNNLNMLIYLDWMSMIFIFTVLLISSMIMLYCVEYMNHDNYNIRFFYLIFLFIMSMLFMIISPNIISMLIGWDGLGLISYCLVIYYQNNSSYNSGMLTILMNRIGDVTILMSISMLSIYGSWNYMFSNNCMNLILLMILISAFTKSAQFPFSSWLPAAMAAPTPVSSLVHSSTLVTAGVYLLIRFHYLFFLNDLIMEIIIVISLLTMVFAGLSAMNEFDIKKIIAYSTLSQLGLMIMIFGFKNWELSFFHLIIHAMFKSMMFMCSGILIHMMLNNQDIRNISKFKFYFPLTFSMLLISNLSLCGMPFMSGFYSKDQILEMMFMKLNNLFIYLLLIFGTMLTVMYSIRLIYYLMNKSVNINCMNNITENKMMSMSLFILMMLTMIFGMLMNWMVFNNIEYIFLMFQEKMLILIICFMSVYMYMYMDYTKMNLNNYFMNYFLGKMYFMYNFIPMLIINPMKFGNKYYYYFDKGWSEMFLKNSMINLSKNINFNLNNNNMLYMFLNLNFIIIMYMYMY
ncbi:NADH dehydrogenase subunit 5 (mitochondrion) [Muscidifurax raptorellus]|uniref:NADH dehydrogenase subunit 5 n=1 Tax=Muscidifurax raptorellus TaxID=51938 RepID=UPI001E7B00D7|nr:NADH dehydrogenase subunit 5 [Muscidifurax raptorellus]UAT98635.1 NADH dehydrogenase subunit 5 [Muscidifurax raptorellus]